MASPAPQAAPQPSQRVGYDALRECHKRAYAYLTEALEIDEGGVGDRNAAIDYYSKGVTELEKGISYNVHGSGEELSKAANLKEKMKKNLVMAQERIAELLDGDELKGCSPSSSTPSTSKYPLPTESLQIMTRKKLGSKKPTDMSPPGSTSSSSGRGVEGSGRPLRPKVAGTPASVGAGGMGTGDGRQRRKEEKKKAEKGSSSFRDNMKGVDRDMAQRILDQLVEFEIAITWDDIVGLELPKRTLQEIVILPALRPELFTGLRSPARGLLLFGPPGNGKTMLAKAVAHESKAKFFNISAASLTSKWVSEGEKLVKALFAMARELQPSVIFLDEVDALLSRRGDSEHDAMRRLKNEFLQSFDGMSSSQEDRVLVMAATNRPQELDDAALRRFEKRIYIPLPSFEARKLVLKKLLAKHNNNLSSRQLESVARECEGYSASDLTALAKDAALGPIRDVDYETLRHLPANKIRPMSIDDFGRSMRTVRPSVNPGLIEALERWNLEHGVSA